MIIHLFDFVKGDALLGKPPFARSWHRLATLVLAPQGDFLMGRKSPKTLQREIPLESPGLICFFLFRPKSALGLVGRIGWHGASLGSFTPLIASTPSTRASSFGVEASPGRSRPGCTTGRAETRRTAHHPSRDGEKESHFSSWYGKRPSARPGKQLLTAWNSGVDSTRRGKAPPLAILSSLSHR